MQQYVSCVSIKHGCKFISDIDVMPNVGLRHQFLELAARRLLFSDVRDLTAYVLPAFEVRKGSKFPKDKKELLEGVSKSVSLSSQ